MVTDTPYRKRAVIIISVCFTLMIVFYFNVPTHLYNAADLSFVSSISKTTFRGGQNISIVVLLTGKAGYTGFTASTIRKLHHIKNEDVSVVARPDFNRSQLTDWYGKDVGILAEKSTEASLRMMLRTFIESGSKVLFMVDSSTLFMPRWKDFITRYMIDGNVTFLSLYHSSFMHDPVNDCQKYYDEDLCEGPLQRRLGIAMSHEFAKMTMSKHYDLFEECYWNEILKKENKTALYPRKSLVMYIDQKNQDKDFCGETDVPYEFQLCDLPCWVRDGIEFFFDRCTNPQELYLPGISDNDTKTNDRMWTKPVVSYSLYGGKTRYTNGAITNAKRVFSIYPGWKIWMYMDNSVPGNIMNQLCSKSIRFINLTGTDIKNQMSWRFLIASEPVKMFTILDIDYRILTRGKAAVDDWIKSGRKFHVMRDHPNHSRYPMSGGMWGGMGNSIPNIRELILKYSGNNNYMVDMNFLNGVIWPIVKQNALVHDSHSIHKFGEDHPFPTKSEHGEFVGNVDFS